MTTGQRTIEFYLYVSGDYTDCQTFLSNLEISASGVGFSKNGTTFSKVAPYSVDEHTAESEFYPLVDSAYINGLSVSSTLTFNNVNWS